MNEPAWAVEKEVDEPGTSAFVPVLILGLTMLAWFGFQVTQLHAERDAMRVEIARQAQRVEASTKLRASLDAIAQGTLTLADQGNAGAKLIVDELKRRGVNIGTDARAR